MRARYDLGWRCCACLVITLGASAQERRDPSLDTPIEEERLAEHVKILASDAFEGRGPATAGEQKTIDYLIEQLKAAGVTPGGEPDGNDGRKWTQDVALTRSEIQGEVRASIASGSRVLPLQQGQDIAIMATYHPIDYVSIPAAPLVFVGYGVNAPERNWDDFKGVDLRGKVAVVLVNDPDFEADLGGRFGGKAMTYYGRWTYKFEEAARQGALGMLVVHETEPAAYGWKTVKNSFTIPVFDIVRPNPSEAHPLLQGWIQREVAIEIFQRAGLDFEAEKAKAKDPSFTPVPLADTSLSVDYAAKHSTVVTRNVAGRIVGSTYPDETVIYTAHWDHLGIGDPDETGDRIYNGAWDNALGVAALLELARVFAAEPRPARSVVFLAVGAEEAGLLGSEYYAQNPLYPLATTAAVYNTDGGSPALAWDVSFAGDGKVSLQDDLAAAAQLQGRRLSPDSRPEAGRFYRSDHFSFAKVGVPAISFTSGMDWVEGGTDAGNAWRDEYVAKRYHQPADEWSPDWDLRGEVVDIGLLYKLGSELANSRRWPTWGEGSEFRSLREATSASRK